VKEIVKEIPKDDEQIEESENLSHVREADPEILIKLIDPRYTLLKEKVPHNLLRR
jgi:hypothetical protein